MVLFQSINNFADPQGGIGLPSARRRRLYIPPSTNYPLFSYGDGDDQRSFLSLIETGSHITDLDDDNSDAASVSTSRSLPSSLSSVNTDHESLRSWLLEESQRSYSAAQSEDEDNLSNHSRYSRTSLLSSKFSTHDFGSLHTSYSKELSVICQYSFPLIITFLLEHLFSIVCLIVVGHLGKDELAAVSLGSMTTTITFAVFEGIATALDTLCPQAYGAKNYELVSIHVQRCLLFSLVAYVPCAIAWWYSSVYLKYIIDSDNVLKMTESFLRILTLGGPGYIFFEVSKRFLQAQGIFEAGTGILFLSAPINIFLSWFLVWNEKFGMGFNGAPIATVINFYLMDILLILYVMFIDGKKCWFGLASVSDLCKQWGNLSKLAIPGIVMLESEYFAYEIMTLMASYMGTVDLAAQSAVSSIASLTYMIPFAISIAGSTRVANFIGGHNIRGAQIAIRVTLFVGLVAAFINCLVLFSLKSHIASIFTSDTDVKSLVIDLFNPLVSVIQIFDGLACVSSGILRAEGSQRIGGYINFLAYYAVAIPSSLALNKLFDLKLFGLWLGIGGGMILIAISEILVIVNSDWDHIMMKAELLNDAAFDSD
ncbi:hypothetical protein PSN45_003190 [Yamadazyma tenuis]|uniref:MATE efflux family protein n=1 Tax=Candida tenuis (strain ATCC 10573 / BCRC 21748 / CBS 615 / JCM 9827 / NBRC 10315 / NRRL Y-1498 / VKM Y-70) TaxID=590646 RepID=G3AZ32_CANTC|nr:MATE efflux family protein [Yamadazyma tenuis ATCC 10573]EGV65993.1 MATE efflux family protein [Yamadazyma tenuis ATCC 10573]WEJ95666.1 hypothetical protein PSN45_003190 [Yamadazyma tenuis]